MIRHEAKNLKRKLPLLSPPSKQPIASAGKHNHIDVAALAEIYNSPPGSRILKEELLEEARRALMEYELAEEDMEIAAHTLARTMHMLVEQRGGKSLEPEHKAELVHHVLDWCGIRCRESEKTNRSSNKPEIAREELVRRPESTDKPLPKHHHATKRPN